MKPGLPHPSLTHLTVPLRKLPTRWEVEVHVLQNTDWGVASDMVATTLQEMTGVPLGSQNFVWPWPCMALCFSPCNRKDWWRAYWRVANMDGCRRERWHYSQWSSASWPTCLDDNAPIPRQKRLPIPCFNYPLLLEVPFSALQSL